MTMLDRMRRHKGWLKWSLVLVCLAFIVFYIPDFLESPGADAAPGSVVARVNGAEITVGEFRRAYFAQLDAYRATFGGDLDENLIRQLGFDQQILQQMVDEEAAIVEARRLGFSASDMEVRDRIISLPAFQEGGQFIGEARYRDLLRLQRPPITPAEFETAVRRSLVIEKLRAALTDWITVSNDDVAAEFRRRNERVRLDVIALTADAFRASVEVTDDDLREHFDANAENYRVPEGRRVRYVLVDTQDLREHVTVSDQDIERHYNDTIDQFTLPEQVRASHILLSDDGREAAAARAQAEDLLAQVRAGADFADLARRFSDDEGTREAGGDLGYFGRGQMVPEFEQAAFALEPGEVSDIIETFYGLHIVKVVDRTEGSTETLDEVREQIRQQLRWERAQAQAATLAERLGEEIERPEDLARVAAQRGLAVRGSDYFARNEPIAGLGPAPDAVAQLFAMEVGEVSPPLPVPDGYAVFTVTDRREAHVPSFEDARDRVREDVTRIKALAAARERAEAVVDTLKSAPDFAAAARAAGLVVESTDRIPRGSPLPGIGISALVDEVAFALEEGAVSDPIVTGTAAAIVRLAEREPVDEEALDAARISLRQELLAERRNRFFTAYMARAMQRMRIEINRETLQQVVV